MLSPERPTTLLIREVLGHAMSTRAIGQIDGGQADAR